MTILVIILAYLALVMTIGTMSHRLFRGTGEDYFVASRSIGPFFLLMALFGTNMTAFAILGASGEAYHKGIGVFALMPSASALVIPSVFFFVGTRVWALGKRHGYLTQIQFFRDRWGSDAVGIVLFLVSNVLLIPYLLIGVMGGGVTVNQITKDAVPAWVGSALVTSVVFVYVCFGGMRGTTWANVFQTIVFMTFGTVTMLIIVNEMGGLTAAMTRVKEQHPELLIRGDHFKPLHILTYTLVPLSVGMFPHMFSHWLTAKRASSFRYPLMFYPVCIALVWFSSVTLGLLGSVEFDLKGPAANSVMIRMIDRFAPGVLAGLLAAGVLAAIMSSLDSQALAIGSMFTNDIVRHFGFHDQMSEKQQVLFGRVFLFLVLATTFVLSLVSNRSIFRLGEWCFTGFASMFPVVIAALFWKRSTKWGAMASILTVVVLWTYFFVHAGENDEYTIGGTGVMPVAVILAASGLAMIVGSLLTTPPDEERLRKFFPAKTAG